ncbi:MAG: LAGLIDADG family homing endonuclease [Patescibacteria group bacterium]
MVYSEKTSHAGNQQERLITIGWIIGYVDGEGCFSVNFIKQQDRKEAKRIRKGYKTGYQIAHEFAVTQGEKSLESLKIIQKFFGVGNIYINKRYDNHNEHIYRFVVRRRSDINTVIIPFFKRYQLKTAKQDSFKVFSKCLDLMNKGKHLTRNGAIQIASLCRNINHRKSRIDVIKILRNQTSDSKRVKQIALRR